MTYRADSEFEKALELYLRAAEQDHAGAQCQVGYCCEKGLGCDPDPVKAFAYYKKSAENGDATGCNNLGYLYERGVGCDRDEAAAVEWYRRAAEGGLALGCRNLAIHLEGGTGCGKDERAALDWYRKALEGGEDCTEAIKRLTTGRRSNRIAYTIMIFFTILVTLVCSWQFFTGTEESGILALAGIVGTILCARMLTRLQPLEGKKEK